MLGTRQACISLAILAVATWERAGGQEQMDVSFQEFCCLKLVCRRSARFLVPICLSVQTWWFSSSSLVLMLASICTADKTASSVYFSGGFQCDLRHVQCICPVACFGRLLTGNGAVGQTAGHTWYVGV